jgi:hypothetical protein
MTSTCTGCGKVSKNKRINTPKPIRLCDDCFDTVKQAAEGEIMLQIATGGL